MHRKVHIVALVVALALLLPVLGGCGSGRAAEEEPTPASVRTPQPTFTPTPITDQSAAPTLQPIEPIAPAVATDVTAAADAAAPVANAAPQAAQSAAAPVVQEQPGFGGPVAEVQMPSTPPPLGIINTELVNSRTGPDVSFPVVIVLGRGEEYDVTGKNGDGSWLRICCVEDKDAWVSAEFIDVADATDGVPIAQAGELSALALEQLNAPPTATPVTVVDLPAAVAPAAVVADSAPAAAAVVAAAATDVVADPAAPAPEGYTLVATERFPESSVVRVFLYVYQGNQALEGYTLRVTRDGAEQAVSETSFGPAGGFTWPIADERQRFQNFKAEFPGVPASGTWAFELVKDGAVVSSPATFALAEGDGQSELYVRFERR